MDMAILQTMASTGLVAEVRRRNAQWVSAGDMQWVSAASAGDVFLLPNLRKHRNGPEMVTQHTGTIMLVQKQSRVGTNETSRAHTLSGRSHSLYKPPGTLFGPFGIVSGPNLIQKQENQCSPRKFRKEIPQ